MKRLIYTGILLFITASVTAQVSPSNLNAPAGSQPVPNSSVSEKSAPSPKPLIPVTTTNIPPIYPGAETHAAETQRNLIFPASPPAPTQPAQREPLHPIEATNNLAPTQPPREEASRNNPVIQVTP